MEILDQFTNPVLVAAVMAIVGLIKDKWFFAKINTRFISIGVSIILIAVMRYIAPDPSIIITIENILLVILPAIGYDYIYAPVLKPIFDLLKGKKEEEEEV